MTIHRLELSGFRNITHANIEPSAGINIIYGENGGGKTSLLEAIYYLGLGRSFRSHLGERVVQNSSDKFTLFAKTSATSVGMERFRNGRLRFKIADQDIHTISQLAKRLPLQLINPDAYQLLNEGPKFRREFMDWGVFHMEHSFFSAWKEFNKIIKHRNLALKMQASREEVQSWDQGFVSASNTISQLRKEYIDRFIPIFSEILAEMLTIKGGEKISIDYSLGWDSNLGLMAALRQTLTQDFRYGSTQRGPHRSDLIIKIGEAYAKDMLSRGQQKLFVYALRLAQGLLLDQHCSSSCIYLIDDLPAELDKRHRDALFSILQQKIKAQIFISSVELEPLTPLLDLESTKVFHVEQGAFSRVTDKSVGFVAKNP